MIYKSPLKKNLPKFITRISFPQFKPMQADITFANILAGPLAELAPVLIENTRPGGWLCLSGILEEQANSVIEAYQSAFDFEPIRKKEEWVCLTARKH